MLQNRKDEFAELLVAEQGKAITIAKAEFDRALVNLRGTASLKLEEEVVEVTEDSVVTLRYVPIGVTCALVPWNFPVVLAMWKIGPAIYAGNSIILKPSPDTPYASLKLVELGARIFPPGVLQVLSGGHELGPLCTAHPDIDMISFTGSTVTGRLVMESCAKTLKRVTLELGGNDAAIVCEDVDLAKVVPVVSSALPVL